MNDQAHALYDVLVETLRESLLRTRDLEIENRDLRHELRSRDAQKEKGAEAPNLTHNDAQAVSESPHGLADAWSVDPASASSEPPHESAGEDDEQSPLALYLSSDRVS